MGSPLDDDAIGATLAVESFSSDAAISRDPAISAFTDRGRIAGRYELLALLGSGGMGSVYRARDHELDEIVAMKVLRRELIGSPDALERFRREVKLARRVTHRNVARTFDLGEHDGERFITLELIEGEPLSAVLARNPILPMARVRAIVAGVLDGLRAAHAAGVVHRDLKPDNVILGADGRVVITDFGVARAAAHVGGIRQTAVGAAIGTPGYMAPEQVAGSPDVDTRADIYAFGAMLFELLTGHLPFERASPLATAAARLTEPPPDPRVHRKELPGAVASLVLDCLATDPEHRIPSVDLLAERFDATQLTEVAAPSRLPTPAALPGVMTLAAAGAATPAHKTVAVTPFRSGADDAYLADGLWEDLIDVLSTTEGLRVRPPGMVQTIAATETDAREIGRRLEVQAVVEGSIRRTPSGLRIAVRVQSVDDGFQIWAGRVDRPEAAFYAASDEIAQSVAAALTVVAARPSRDAPTDPAALDLYLRARREAHGFWPGATARATALFQEALAISPSSPLLLAGYARIRLRAWFHGDDPTFGAEAREAVERAYAAAPDLAEANLAFGTWQLYSGDPARAVHHLRRACDKGPTVAESHDVLGRLLLEANLPEEGIRRLMIASAMEPRLASVGHVERARFHYLRHGEGDLAESARLTAELAELPDADAPRYYAIGNARFALWSGDVTLLRACLAAFANVGGAANPIAAAFVEVATDGKVGPALIHLFGDLATDGRSPPRRRSLFHQMGAELAAFLGEDEIALAQIEAADRVGLVDRMWITRCPLFSKMAGHARMVEVQSRVEARADAVVAAWQAA